MILLSHFSSLLEVITAIYISMCMDEVLRGVWSPKYYDDLERALKDYYIEGHEVLIQRIVRTNKAKASSISMFMKNRAAFLAIITILMILLLGYEDAFQKDVSAFYIVGMLMFSLALSTIIPICLNTLAFSRRQNTATAVLTVVVMTFGLTWINELFFHYMIPHVWIIHIVLFVLILPILWQVFVCWMFSSAYKGYIRRKLENGKQNYEMAKKGLEEHNEKIIPRRYLQLYHTESIKSDNAEEAKNICLDNYLELMEYEISKASDPSSVFKIFFSWTWFHITSLFMRIAVSLHVKNNNTIHQKL